MIYKNIYNNIDNIYYKYGKFKRNQFIRGKKINWR